MFPVCFFKLYFLFVNIYFSKCNKRHVVPECAHQKHDLPAICFDYLYGLFIPALCSIVIALSYTLLYVPVLLLVFYCNFNFYLLALKYKTKF